MKCRACGKEGFTNPYEVGVHRKTECSAAVTETVDIAQTVTVDFDVAAPAPVTKAPPVETRHFIPIDKCPPELKWLAAGDTVGFKLLGRITKDKGGVLVDHVEHLRGW